MKKVNALMSTYNGEKYLRELMDSVMAQTYHNIDFYIRDDGSSDQTVSIIKSYMGKEPEGIKIILINEEDGIYQNMGAHQSYLYASRFMKPADIYVFFDQDDVALPDKVERVVEHISRYPENVPVLYGHKCYICDSNLNIEGTTEELHSMSPEEIAHYNFAKIVMAGTWAGVGMTHASNHIHKEFTWAPIESGIAIDCWQAWVLPAEHGAFIYDNKPLAKYRRHEGVYSSGNAGGLKKYKDWLHHYQRHCTNIKKGILCYKKAYYDKMSMENKKFLDIFTSQNGFQKCFYPHRLRDKLLDEIAFRILGLFNKI